MKVVILGCGRVGAQLAKMMLREGHEVVVIDQIRDAFDRLGAEARDRVHTVVGDGIDEDVLRDAGLDTADAFTAVTNGDNRNIMAAQIAKYIFHVPRVICRIYDPIRQATYKGLDLDSISPTIVGAQMIHDEILNGSDAAAPRRPATASGGPARPANPPERTSGRATGAAAPSQA